MSLKFKKLLAVTSKFIPNKLVTKNVAQKWPSRFVANIIDVLVRFLAK